MTLEELTVVDEARAAKASACKVVLAKTHHTVATPVTTDTNKKRKSTIKKYFITLVFQVTSDSKTRHKVYIQLNPDFSLKNWKKNTVKVACDCSDFIYRAVYILNQNGALFVNDRLLGKYSTALKTAPKKEPECLVCKHVYAAILYLINNYKAIMNQI